MNKFSTILWGIVFITLGVIFGLNSMEIVSINIFFKGWWTLFIIVPCCIGLITKDDKMVDLVGLAVGVVILAIARDIISLKLVIKLLSKLFFPAILVIIGISMIAREITSSKISSKIKELNKNELFNYTATFSGENVKFPNKEFKGATVNAIFGEENIDLRNAIIYNEVVLNTTAIFGKINLLVLNNVNIEVKSISIFGKTDNKVKTINQVNEKIPTIYINAFNLFGGIKIN